uniref:Uncharacterized protein n=1 Tax=Glossina pallidipes TaxID=7398 RepID=A0A1A9Z8Z0_GLOPL
MSNCNNRGLQLFNKSKALDIAAEHVVRRTPKMKIRTEEKYIEEVVKIIKRDFFADVEQVKGRNKNCNAFRRKRAAIVARQIRSALFEATNSVLIWSAEDDSLCGCGEPNWFLKNERTSASDEHSLDPFVQLYISKDTNDIYAFAEIMQVATQELKQKYTVACNEKNISTERFAKLLISSLWSPPVTFAEKEVRIEKCITDGLLQIPKRTFNLTDALLQIPTNKKSENSLLTDGLLQIPIKKKFQVCSVTDGLSKIPTNVNREASKLTDGLLEIPTKQDLVIGDAIAKYLNILERGYKTFRDDYKFPSFKMLSAVF